MTHPEITRMDKQQKVGVAGTLTLADYLMSTGEPCRVCPFKGYYSAFR
jgi:hypothetical protein